MNSVISSSVASSASFTLEANQAPRSHAEDLSLDSHLLAMGITLDGGSPARGRGRCDLAVMIAVANGRVSGLTSGHPDRPPRWNVFILAAGANT